MGRIKPMFVKRVAENLLKNYRDEFTDDFNVNKIKVQELSDVKSKTIRNKIAGYITRMIKRESKLSPPS
ncbi:MAG TPA: 30S ribosomal protein S17e [Candidatus Altiarchaeales archaeon]|nr:MAG: 30S ribosomal protein S17e [Candidatus Altiarchaeales archaeon]HDN83064.1 30S ribosomal protein S17e [Candidatus Altiarchaeales archaeon]